MKYLVDANVLCEATKPVPEPKVLEWLRTHEPDIAVDPIILGEIQFGIERLPKGKRRQRLEEWFSRGVTNITCVAIEAAVGTRWAKLVAGLHESGKTMPVKDSLIAATALTYGLTLVTRNTRDFRTAGVQILDPFS